MKSRQTVIIVIFDPHPALRSIGLIEIPVLDPVDIVVPIIVTALERECVVARHGHA